MDAAEIVATICPELAKSGEAGAFIRMARENTGRGFFGGQYQYAVAYRACHLFTVTRGAGGSAAAGAVHLHPGGDYQCRCCALARFDEIIAELEGANAPLEPTAGAGGDLTAKAMAALVDNPKSKARENLEGLRVKAQTVKAFEQQPTEAEIISRIAGGDKTKGSCSSAANAYIASKGGFDVRDFRGGKSRDLFAYISTSVEMANFNGVESFIVRAKDQVQAAYDLLSHVEVGKEYKLGVGMHEAIVKKLENGILQYLELQDSISNGWKNFKADTLTNRFACSMLAYDCDAYLTEVKSLAKNREFIELMRYINTAEGSQQKGAGGSVK